MSQEGLLLSELTIVETKLDDLDSTFLFRNNISYYSASIPKIHLEVYNSVTESIIIKFIRVYQRFKNIFKKILGISENARVADMDIILQFISKCEKENAKKVKEYEVEKWVEILKLRNSLVHSFDPKLGGQVQTESTISKIREYSIIFKRTIILLKENK